MIRLFQIGVFSCLLFWAGGCGAPEKEKPIWERVKLRDIASSNPDNQPVGRSLKTINFNVYIFEMPAERVGVLDDVWKMLYMEPVRFSDFDAFRANLFLVGFGHSRALNGVVDLVHSAGGRKAQTVSVLLPDEQYQDIGVASLYGEKTVFYTPVGGSTEGVVVGPGRLALRVEAERIPGFRGLCSVKVRPAFAPTMRSPVQQAGGRARSGEFLFDSASFQLKMTAGDFFFLGPKEYVDGQMTLASYFFSRPAPSRGMTLLIPPSAEGEAARPYFGPVVRTYMVLCTGIND
ncbi:MAG TPA: hypothetical protein VMW16_04655 [Sedimentisphaerales bacterium]|nr:hypothetical protein [Sedimentisphaerales bacterium]